MISSETNKPPNTGAAIGRMISAPTPLAHSIGANPTMIVVSVSSLGRVELPNRYLHNRCIENQSKSGSAIKISDRLFLIHSQFIFVC